MNTAFNEAVAINLFSEYNSIRNQPNKSDYDKGRELVYQGIIKFIKNDPTTGDLLDDSPEQNLLHQEILSLIKNGGKILNNGGNIRDALFWSFIPRRFYGDINHCFDKIGDWRS